MNIGICTGTYLPTVNGVVYHVEDIKKAYKKYGHTVYIFTPAQMGYTDKEENVVRLPAMPNPLAEGYPITLPYLFTKNELEDYDLDVIHTHHAFGIATIATRMANSLGIPLVYTNHTRIEKYVDYYSPIAKDEVKKLIVSELRRFANKCNLIIAPTPDVKKMLKEYHIRAKIEVVNNGLNTDFFKKTPSKLKSELRIPENARVLLFVGRLSDEKHVDKLIEVFISAKLDNTYLLLAGDGPQRSKLEKLSKVSPRVLFCGNIERELLPKYYSIADYFITLSVTEVMPLTILEAFACEIPVIALKNEGMDTFVQDSVDGFLLEGTANSQIDMLQKIITQTNSDAYSKMAVAARQSSQKYSVENSAKRLIELYNGLID